MEKRKISLNTISAADETIMLDILTNNIVKQTYMLPDYECREDAIPLFHRLITLSMDQTRYVRGIYLGDILIGFVNDVEIKNRTIELGYVIHPRYHGNGYMTQVLKTAIKNLFTAGFDEIITGAFEENLASIRVMEKAGMTRLEKTEEIEYRGRIHNCIYYHVVSSGDARVLH